MLDLDRTLSASIQAFYAGPHNEPPPSPWPAADAIDEVTAMGLGVEVWTEKERYRPFDEATIRRLASALQSARPVTVHTGVASLDPEALGHEIGVTARLGGSVLVIHCDTLDLAGEREPDWGAVEAVAARGREAGVTLALENSGKIGIAPLRRAAERFGLGPAATGLGFCIDLGHAHRSEPIDGVRPEAFLAEFAAGIIELHVHDNFGDEDLHLVPGEGSIDWPPVAEAMRGLGPETVVCLELKAAGRAMEAIGAGRTFLADLV